MQILIIWFHFVITHIGRIILDLLTIILSPIIIFLYSKRSGFSKKKFNSIIITGASSGIGKAVAIEFAKPGVTLFLTGRDEYRLDQVKTSCESKGATVVVKKINVTDKAAMKEFIQSCDKIAPIDLVIANAGVGISTLKDPYYPESASAMVDININGVLNTILPCIPLFQTYKKGHIAIIGSMLSYLSNPLTGMYAPTKVCLRYLSDDLRPQLKLWNIDTTFISPGYVNSRMCPASNNSKNFGFMYENEASLYIKNGLENNLLFIDFPHHVFDCVFLTGNLHPITHTLLVDTTIVKDHAIMSLGKRIEIDPNDEFGGEC